MAVTRPLRTVPEQGSHDGAAVPRQGIRFGVELTTIIAFFALASTLSLADKTTAVGTLGMAATVAVLVIGAAFLVPVLVIKGSFNPLLKPVMVLVVLLTAWYVFELYLQGSMKGWLFNVGLLVFYLALMIFAASVRWTNAMLSVMGWALGLWLLMVGGMWLAAGMPMNFAAFMINPNSLAGFGGFSLFFLIIHYRLQRSHDSRILWGAILLLSIATVFATNTRAIWLGLALAGVTYWLWTRLARHRGWFSAYFWIIIVAIAATTILYPVINFSGAYEELQETSMELTGKSVQSGRHIIWMKTMYKIAERPVVGFGPAGLPRTLGISIHSAHNMYLQVMLQSGAVGLLLFIVLFFMIWRTFWLRRHDWRVRLAGSFFIALLIHQNFDVSLPMNSPSIGMLQWLMIGVGLSFVLYGNGGPEQSPGTNGAEQPEVAALD